MFGPSPGAAVLAGVPIMMAVVVLALVGVLVLVVDRIFVGTLVSIVTLLIHLNSEAWGSARFPITIAVPIYSVVRIVLWDCRSMGPGEGPSILLSSRLGQ